MALNIEAWEPWEVDFIMENESLTDLYQNGNFPFTLRALFSDEQLEYEIKKAQSEGSLSFGKIIQASNIDETREYIDISSDDYYTYVKDWKDKALEGNRSLIESGLSEQYELDPTPWDEVTSNDSKVQSYYKKVFDREQAFETAKTSQWEERKGEIESAYSQAVEDIDTLRELSPLREESQVLAEEDIDNYINRATQRLKLRGVASQFDEENRQQLIQERFSDYWSEENDILYTDLYSQYGDPDQYSIDDEFGIMKGNELFVPSTIVPYEEYAYEREEDEEDITSLLKTSGSSLL